MPSEAQQKAALISAISSSKAYFFEPKEPEKSRFRREAWPVAWPLCRYRHNAHNAVIRIMLNFVEMVGLNLR